MVVRGIDVVEIVVSSVAIESDQRLLCRLYKGAKLSEGAVA